MQESYIIKNARIFNEGIETENDVLIKDGHIDRIDKNIRQSGANVIDASGLYLLPGVIDDQVHFREPGLTHKANIYTESRAAVAGGITSFMEMPNTIPQAVTQEKLEEKYSIAASSSAANYSFFMGTTNDNLDEIIKTDPRKVCGVKIFMGSSTGDMLVDDDHTLSKVFANCPVIISLHCEDEQTILNNIERAKHKYGNNIPIWEHPNIRSREACYMSSSKAIELAKRHNTRIHILHISTAEELALFGDEQDFTKKRITSEVCVHHLTFTEDDYETLGTKIKCNPAIKKTSDREALWTALREGKLDVIATDHAPHTFEEKQNDYLKAPSGLPLVQHSLLLMMERVSQGDLSMKDLVNRMCHRPADLFQIDRRGYIREGYWADLVLVDPNRKETVEKKNLLYKCGWSPLEGKTFNHQIAKTFVSGNLIWSDGSINDGTWGQRLTFNR